MAPWIRRNVSIHHSDRWRLGSGEIYLHIILNKWHLGSGSGEMSLHNILTEASHLQVSNEVNTGASDLSVKTLSFRGLTIITKFKIKTSLNRLFNLQPQFISC
ncbi:hypothetical protein BsWGS_03862 [Bradybaena similaris]